MDGGAQLYPRGAESTGIKKGVSIEYISILLEGAYIRGEFNRGARVA